MSSGLRGWWGGVVVWISTKVWFFLGFFKSWFTVKLLCVFLRGFCEFCVSRMGLCGFLVWVLAWIFATDSLTVQKGFDKLFLNKISFKVWLIINLLYFSWQSDKLLQYN